MVAGDNRPIGVFDSGIGGLTVVRELIRQLPTESIHYFGDTARVPYGPKSPDTVRRYSSEITSFLMNEGVKAIVVACNTATAHALQSLREALPVPVIGVIGPGARAAVAASRGGTIGVIGTRGTIASGAYERAIHALVPDARVIATPCPLFVPLVEEGWTRTDAARLIATEYLSPMLEQGMDTLVLGCTHYPLLKPMLGEMLGDSIALIDSARETASETGGVLEREGISAGPGATPEYRFMASDDPAQFLTLGKRFLGSAIHEVETIALG
jgi:glutamate racemase